MFPDFVNVFRDTNNKVHLFFFPGLNDNSENIWKSLDLSKTGVKYDKIDYSDGAEEFIFEREDISKIVCKLVNDNGNLKTIELVL